MTEPVDHHVRIEKLPALAEGSPFSAALTELGEPGIRALGLLRSADRFLTDEQAWDRRGEIVISCCRGAVEGLLKLAGDESQFEGAGSVGHDLSDKINKMLQVRRTGSPLARLERELDALDSLPDQLTRQDGVYSKLKGLAASRKDRKTPVEDPSAVFAARVALVEELDALGALPERLSAGDPVLTRLQELLDARREHETSLRERLADELDAVEEAFRKYKDEQANQWRYRAGKVSKLVRDQTRREPGAGELQAIRAWSDFYSNANVTVHGGYADTAMAAGILRKVVAAIEQLFVALTARAPQVLELAAAEQPTQVDADEVARIIDPRASTDFFRKAKAPEWLDLLPDAKLLPEKHQWVAEPYLERLAAEDPEQVATWLNSHLDAITQRRFASS